MKTLFIQSNINNVRDGGGLFAHVNRIFSSAHSLARRHLLFSREHLILHITRINNFRVVKQ